MVRIILVPFRLLSRKKKKKKTECVCLLLFKIKYWYLLRVKLYLSHAYQTRFLYL